MTVHGKINGQPAREALKDLRCVLCKTPIGLNDFARLESKGRSRGITKEEFKELLISAVLTEIKKLCFKNLFRSPTLVLRKK